MPQQPGPDADDQTSAPLPESQRIASLDVLRGVAVLGILAMNIRNFGLPLREFDNPRFPRDAGEAAGLGAADLWSWAVANVFFEDKMIALFSILFGAGVVVFADRLAATGRSAFLHLRRMFWLLVIGLFHAYVLWYGDILNTYAVCGLVLWPLRRLKAPLLIGIGVAVLLVSVWARVGPPMLRTLDQERGQPVAQGAPSASRQIMQRAMRDEEGAYRGTYADLFRWRANLNTAWHFYGGVAFGFWRSAGYMLIGMGLIRLRVLDASRPALQYVGSPGTELEFAL